MYLVINLDLKETCIITEDEFESLIFNESIIFNESDHVSEDENSTTWFCEDGTIVIHTNESKESDIDFKKLGKEIASLVKVNAHGAAYEFIAQELGYDDLEERFQLINYHHDRIGHLIDIQRAKRHTAYNELIKRGELDHGKLFTQYIYGKL